MKVIQLTEFHADMLAVVEWYNVIATLKVLFQANVTMGSVSAK